MMGERRVSVYIARLLSFDAEKVDVIQKILENAAMQSLVFPAKVYTTGDNQTTVTSAEQVIEVFNQKQTEKKPIVVLTLYPENGLELSFTFYFAGVDLPVVTLLKFTIEHVENGTLTLNTFNDLIRHTIEELRLDHATVYDDATIPYPQGLKYFKGPKERRYPIQLGWLNYFAKPLVEFIGHDKFEIVEGYTKLPHADGGITLTYENEFAVLDDDHQFIEAKAIEQLGLTRL
jgi:hypothetical protein